MSVHGGERDEGWRWISGGVRLGRAGPGGRRDAGAVGRRAARPDPVRCGPSRTGAGADRRGARPAQRRGGGRGAARCPASTRRRSTATPCAASTSSGASEQTPVVLPVVGEIPAGSRHPLRLQPGQAVRVVAGAPLPTLADAVVPVGRHRRRHGQADGAAQRAVGGVRPADRGGRPARRRRRAPRRDPRPGAGRHAGRGRPRQGAGAPAAPGVGDRGRRRARRRRAHPRGRAGPGRLLPRAHRGRPRRRAPSSAGPGWSAPTRASCPRPCRTGCRSATSWWCAGPSAVRPGREVAGRAADLGDLDTTRVAMHPGSTQGFGRLGPDGVPTFLFPAHPATALLLFEVMVRPLIRLALGSDRPVPPHRRRPADLAGHLAARSARLPARPAAARPRGRLPRAAARHRRHAPAVVAGRLQRADRAARAGHGGDRRRERGRGVPPDARVSDRPLAHALPEPGRHPGWPARLGALRTAAGRRRAAAGVAARRCRPGRRSGCATSGTSRRGSRRRPAAGPCGTRRPSGRPAGGRCARPPGAGPCCRSRSPSTGSSPATS